jgi:hypothetical protein
MLLLKYFAGAGSSMHLLCGYTAKSISASLSAFRGTA